MTSQTAEQKHLEQLIKNAMQKLGIAKENDICRYLPSTTGEYIHHFTMKKMKNQEPAYLSELISKNILRADSPNKLPPKKRAARGSRKKRENPAFTKQEMEKMYFLAKKAGDYDIARKLTPRKDPRSIKRELISSIRHGRVEPELWSSYVEVMGSQLAAAIL